MLTIRPFEATPTDYETITVIHNAVWPDDIYTVEEWKSDDEKRDAKYFFQRVMAELDGQLVAFADYLEPSWSYVAGKYYITYNVHPDHDGSGVDQSLYDHIMSALAECEPAPSKIMTHMREDKTRELDFLKGHGFKIVMREPISRLDVPAFDSAKFAHAAEKVRQRGIKIYTIRELEQLEPEWKPKLWELEWQVRQDIPSPDPRTQRPFEQFAKNFKGPNYDPEAWFVALDNGECVGYSSFYVTPATKEKLYTRITGVARSHRRMGLATALKVRAIEFAQQYGAQQIETDNEENNPMYQLNLMLGFKPAPGWLTLEKKIFKMSS
ncbi:MAG: GNAT family N-acetyltransferase [Ardenticatenaceae bacterium]